MTIREMAAACNIAESTVRNQIRAGRIRATKRGRDWFVSNREMARYRAESLGKRQPKP